MPTRGPGDGSSRRTIRQVAPWFTPGRRFKLGVFLPIAVAIFSQFESVQNSRCVLAKLPWGVGQCEVIADLLAPLWALAVIPVANRLRRAAALHGTPAEHSESWLASRFTTRQWADGSARLAKWGAALIILLAYTREWARFGERPSIHWFVLVILGTFALLAVPVWWIRDELHQRGVRYLSSGQFPARANRFFMDDSGGRPPRAPHIVSFASVTMVVTFTVLGQIDALLRGMHLPGDPSVGIGGLAAIEQFDLSRKPSVIIEHVTAWRDYTKIVGAQFGSAHDLVTAHAFLDTILTIPAYVVLGMALAAYSWRKRLTFAADSGERRAFELVTLSGLVVLLVTAALDIGKNVFTWYVMDAAWDNRPLTDANVRLLWLFAISRTIGLWTLAASSLLLLALADTATRRLRRAVVAVRSEILLVVLLGFVVLSSPQTADVIRDWRVSHTVITVGLAIVLSMLIRWTSVTNLRLQHRHWELAEQGDALAPPRLRLPYTTANPTVGRLVAALIIGTAALQLLLSGGFRLEVGRGLLVPALIVVVLWVFGLALPNAPYTRGDRQVSLQVRRRLPRILGAMVYLIIGVAVVKAASSSVAFTPNTDWWVFFSLVPPAIGLWRVFTRTTATMGALEAGFAAILLLLAVALFANDDPPLSAAALLFAGITFSYGSLAFFNSYERTSLVNRLSERFLSPAWAQPFVITAGVALVLIVLGFYLDPIAVAPRIGTIGMVLMAMMVFNLLGAGAVRFAELTRPPRILAAFGIKRTPVVALIAVWVLLAPVVVDQRVNNVRVTTGGIGTADIGFDEVWERWEAANLGAPTPEREGSVGQTPAERPVVPLLLVSSSGGGLRAAGWTSFVLDCVFEGAAGDNGPCSTERDGTPPLHRVAIMSGVSGGSLGMAEYLTHVVDGVESPEGTNRWVDEVLGDDYLAAPIGWLFFVDAPRSLFGFGVGISNRAEVMERAWEASWPDDVPGLGRGLTELWATSAPPVVFNGTSVNDGCRVNVSALNADGGSPDVPSCSGRDGADSGTDGGLSATHDLVDFLCPGDDVALSTAAGMSARFPIVSVAGRIAADPERACQEPGSGTVFVVDGGYLEGSGAGTLLDAWEALAGPVEQYNTAGNGACVVPFMLHIDNGYESPSVTANEAVPREFLVPLLTTMNSSSGITAARAEAALAFEQPFMIAGSDVAIGLQTEGDLTPVTSRYVRLVTRAHPGVQAPLGWTLSQSSLDDLRDQLTIEENHRALEEVRTWLDGEMVCLGG